MEVSVTVKLGLVSVHFDVCWRYVGAASEVTVVKCQALWLTLGFLIFQTWSFECIIAKNPFGQF